MDLGSPPAPASSLSDLEVARMMQLEEEAGMPSGLSTGMRRTPLQGRVHSRSRSRSRNRDQARQPRRRSISAVAADIAEVSAGLARRVFPSSWTGAATTSPPPPSWFGSPAAIRRASAAEETSDFQLAMSLQFEEQASSSISSPLALSAAGSAALHRAERQQRQRVIVEEDEEEQGTGAAASGGGADGAEGVVSRRDRLYVVEPAPQRVRCWGCGEHIRRRQARAVFCQVGSRRLRSAHLPCLVAVSGLTRPASRLDVFFSDGLAPGEKESAEAQLTELPAEGGVVGGGVQHFPWPPLPRPQRPRREGVALQNSLMQLDRDFNAEDYEMLLELDANVRSSRADEDVVRARSVLEQLPVSVARPGNTSECSICLETMEAGCELRTLPCMHVFHRGCIDKWLGMPGALRCPIDQGPIVLAQSFQ